MRTVPHSSAESPGLGAIMVMVSSAMKRSCAEEPCWALTPLEMFRGRHFAFHFGKNR